MTNEEYMKHAKAEYYQGVDAEGNERQTHLKKARNILQNLPDGWPGKEDLLEQIDAMLD